MSKDKIIKSYKLKNGEVRYMFRLYMGVDSLTGKAMSTTRRGFKTKLEAQDALAELRVQVNNGTYKKRAVETYKDIYNIWIEIYEETVQDSTFLKTSRIFRNHILPDMGDYKIDRIDVATCQMHVNQWAKKLKRFTMVKAYTAMVITFAMERGLIDKNPFELVRNPTVKKRISLEDDDEENFYTREQLIELLDCFKKEDNLRRYTFFHLLAFSGMRKGEAFTLMWRDVNFVNNEIRINKAVARGEEGLYLGPTKKRFITHDNDG